MVNGREVIHRPLDLGFMAGAGSFNAHHGIEIHRQQGDSTDITSTQIARGYPIATFSIGNDGTIVQYNHMFAYAPWHGDSVSEYAYGIEHAGFTGNPFTAAQLRSSHALVAALIEITHNRFHETIPVQWVPAVTVGNYTTVKGIWNHTDVEDGPLNEEGHHDLLEGESKAEFSSAVNHLLNGETPTGGHGSPLSMYRNPIRDDAFIPLRIDQGVDYGTPVASYPPGLYVYPIGKALIQTAVTVDSGTRTGWPSPNTDDYGGLIVYKLLDGPAKGARVFVAENIRALVNEGDIVDTGIKIAQTYPYYPELETGWWSKTGEHTLARDFGGYSEGQRTACGQNFSDLIKALGGPPGLPESRPIVGTVPDWLPDWKDFHGGHCSGGHRDPQGDLCGGRLSLEQVLSTIRRLESGAYEGNYTAQNPNSSASGAYQFLDGTWNNYKGYTHAKDAPKAIQDEYAEAGVRHILQNHNCKVEWVPAVWFAGEAGASDHDWHTYHPGGGDNTIQDYVDIWMGYYHDNPTQVDDSSGGTGTGGGGCHDGHDGHEDDLPPIEYQSYDLDHIPRGLEHLKSDYYYMLFDSHEIDIRVTIYDQNERPIAVLPPLAISGQVDVDITRPIPRQLTLDLAIPHPSEFNYWIWGDSGNDADDNPKDKGLFHPAHFIKVDYGVLVQRPKGYEFPSGMPPSEKGTYHTWVWHTVFYGVPTNITGDEVEHVLHIEAQSKEFLLQHPNTLKWTPITEGAFTRFSEGANIQVGKMIGMVARTYGELKQRSAHAHEDIYVGMTETRSFIKKNGAWPYIQQLARGAGYYAYYDNEGYLILRKKQDWSHLASTRVVADLSNHPRGHFPVSSVATLPTPGWDQSKWINQVVVSAPRSKSARKPIVRAVVYIQPDDRGSYEDLQRHGIDRGMTEYVTANGKLTAAQAIDLGNRTMAEAQAQFDQFTVDCLPFPHLDMYDPVGVFLTGVDADGDDRSHGTIVIPQKWTLPLVPSQLMTIGFNAPVQVISKLTTARVVTHPGYNPESVYRE